MSAPEQPEIKTSAVAAAPSPQSGTIGFGTGARGWLHACTSFLAVLTVILIGIVYMFTLYRPDLNDPDIWWHMRDAQYLFQHDQFVRQDMYSFTVAGHPWVNTEWLSEIPYYLAYRALGLVGLKSLMFVTSCAIFLLLLYLCYQETRNFKASAAACYCAVFLAAVSFGPRTILFGYFWLVLLLIILARFRRRGDAPLWTVPLLFCLWANTHGSWAIGLIVSFLFAVGGLFGGANTPRWSKPQLRKLIGTGLASVAALFVNPYGWRLIFYPFDLAFKQKLNISHIQEWVSVDFHEPRGKLVLLILVVLLTGAFFRKPRWNAGDVLIVLFALYAGLTYIRFLMLLGIAIAPVFAKMLDFLPPYRPKGDVRALNAVLVAAAIVAMIWFWPHEGKVRRSIEETYPAGAIAYWQAHPPQGNVLNYYLWGGYLGWHDREFNDFIDSRVDVFEYAGVLKDYLDFLGADDMDHRPDAMLDKYHIRYVLFPPSTSKNPLHSTGRVAYVMEHDPHWKAIYQDRVCVLLERQ